MDESMDTWLCSSLSLPSITKSRQQLRNGVIRNAGGCYYVWPIEYSKPTLKCTPQKVPLAYSPSSFANHALCHCPPLVESLDNVPSLLMVNRPIIPLQALQLWRRVSVELWFMLVMMEGNCHHYTGTPPSS